MSVYEEAGYLKINGFHGRFALEHYHFTCPCCGYRLILGTDGSENGWIGVFFCPGCGQEFLASDEACEGSDLHLYNNQYGTITLISTDMKMEG